MHEGAWPRSILPPIDYGCWCHELTAQARSVRVGIPRRAMHASSDSPLALLSQALRIGGLLPPHSAFRVCCSPHGWPMRLSPNGSRGTCIPKGLSTFLHAAFTAHQSRATANANSLCCARNSTFRPALRLVRAVDPVPLRGKSLPLRARDAALATPHGSLARDRCLFFNSAMTVLG